MTTQVILVSISTYMGRKVGPPSPASIHSTLHSTLLQGEYPNFKTSPISKWERTHARKITKIPFPPSTKILLNSHSACILQACIPKTPHSACILQAYLLQTSPQRLHFASIPQKSHLYPIARGISKHENISKHQNGRGGARAQAHRSTQNPHSACISQAYLLLTSPQRLHFANMYPQKSPKSLHFASISPPNIPQRLHFASMYPQKSHLYPIARGVARTQEHAGTHEGARYIHIHSTLHSTLLQGEYPNFKTCPNIKMGEEEHARGHTGARPLKSPQRLHFASISPPNIPTAPAFCKHVSRNIPTAPAFCKHISSRHPHSACILQACIPKNPHSACILQADLLQTSQQRLHFASISPPNIPTAPAFCKHVSAKLASLPYCKGISTHAHAGTHEGALSTLPFGKGSIQTSKSKSKWERRSEHARTHTGARKIPTCHFSAVACAVAAFFLAPFSASVWGFWTSRPCAALIRARPRCVSSRL